MYNHVPKLKVQYEYQVGEERLKHENRYKISTGQWTVFLDQRSNLKFLASSEANSELVKKNKYHHYLGTDGYQC